MKSLHLSQIGLKTNWTQDHSLTANTYQIPPFCGILPLFTALAVSQNNSKMFSIFKLVTPHYDQDTPQFIKASIFPLYPQVYSLLLFGLPAFCWWISSSTCPATLLASWSGLTTTWLSPENSLAPVALSDEWLMQSGSFPHPILLQIFLHHLYVKLCPE